MGHQNPTFLNKFILSQIGVRMFLFQFYGELILIIDFDRNDISPIAAIYD